MVKIYLLFVRKRVNSQLFSSFSASISRILSHFHVNPDSGKGLNDIKNNAMILVYFDVENTLEVPFITGIQRVTREFAKIVLNKRTKLTCHFIPIIYDHRGKTWRHLGRSELNRLLSDKPRSTKFLSRILRRLMGPVQRPKSLNISEFENDSVFLDIDSSWHSRLKREELLSTLKQQHIKIVKLHYDIIPLLFPDTSHPNTISVFEEHFQSHLKYTDLFLCISRQTLNDVVDYCANNAINTPTLRTIRLGGSPSNTPRPDKLTTALPLASPSLSDFGQYILSVGTIEPRKNYPLLLDAFDIVSQNTNLNLVIVGKAGWLADAITTRIKEHPAFGSRIHHLENISNLQLDALYRNAWINVVPSLYEGFGLPVAEALARNCPTICSSAGSLPEVGGRHVRVFSPHVKNELIDMLMTLTSDSLMYEELKSLANEYTPNTWAQTARDIDSCISGKVEHLEK